MAFTNYFSTRDGHVVAGDLRMTDIAAEFGTPLFVYDEGILERKLAMLRDALPDDFTVYYSIKANPNPAIAAFFVSNGCGIEIASEGELDAAIEAGCAPENILFAGPAKSVRELERAVETGIGEIHVESRTELERLCAVARGQGKRVRVALRVNPSAEAQGGAMRMGGKPAQFGIDEEILDDFVREVVSRPEVELGGVHLFTGTQILDASILAQQYRKCIEIALRVAELTGEPIRTVDFGGGLGIPYFPNESELDFELMKREVAAVASEARSQQALASARFVVEPGRFLAGECGLYVTRVNTVKTSRGKTFAIVDGGMNHHLAASGNLGQVIKRNFPIALLDRANAPSAGPVDVVGPLCTPLDSLARAVELPEVREGDLIGVFQSGAYGLSASPVGFLSHPTPAEVLVRGGEARLIRSRGGVVTTPAE